MNRIEKINRTNLIRYNARYNQFFDKIDFKEARSDKTTFSIKNVTKKDINHIDCFVYEDKFAYYLNRDGKYGYLDLSKKNNEIVVKAKFDEAFEFNEGLSKFRLNKKVYFMNTDFKVQIELDEDLDCRAFFYRGLCEVIDKKTEKHGLIDVNGNLVFPCVAYEIDYFSDTTIILQVKEHREVTISKKIHSKKNYKLILDSILEVEDEF